MKQIARCYLRGFLVFGAATVAILANSPSFALDKDQAIENCRASRGKPVYMACKQGGGTHEACFGKAKAIVQTCVASAMNAARPTAPLFSAEKLSKSSSGGGKASEAEKAIDHTEEE